MDLLPSSNVMAVDHIPKHCIILNLIKTVNSVQHNYFRIRFTIGIATRLVTIHGDRIGSWIWVLEPETV
jgi:hypothetical protein